MRSSTIDRKTQSSHANPIWLIGAASLLAIAARLPAAVAPTSQPTTQPASAPASQPAIEELHKEERFSLHFQATAVPQGHTHFPSPYIGPHSIRSVNELRVSMTATAYLGARLLPGTEVYLNPEVAGGRGIGSGTGIADYPNGEAQRVGKPELQPYIARVFLRQTFGLGGEKEWIEPEQNQIAGYRDVSNLTFTIGKISMSDIFDQNAFAHDPRTQFLNFGFIDNTAWDYPADVRGYTWGGAVEFNQPTWALRYGIFAEPKTANGAHYDHHFDEAYGQALELETRHTLFKQQGKVRYMVFGNRAHMGNYDDTLETPAFNEDITLSRHYSWKYGFGINLEQPITDDLGLFSRLGWNDGHTESWAFTEVDATASLGLSLKGTRWGRPDDTVGLAGLISGLSSDHRDYLAAGGVGFMLGDGRLNYAPEQVIEAYYSAKFFKGFYLSADVQFINHPGFNADRGPIWVGALRVHYEF